MTESNVIELLARLSGKETVSADESLQWNLMLDSLSMVTMLIQIEEEFDIELQEADMNPYDLKTVQDVVNMVEKYREGAAYEENS